MEIQLSGFRRYLQPSPALRWHPWAPAVAAVLVIGLVFLLGAAWGHSAATRMATELRIYTEPSVLSMYDQFEATQPARLAIERASIFDAAVIRAARDARSESSPYHRFRISLEDAFFGLFADDRHRRRDLDWRGMYRDSARVSAEYRLTHLSGAAPQWQPTAAACKQMWRGWDRTAQLETAASAYTAVLGRTITAQQLAPLSGTRCD